MNVFSVEFQQPTGCCITINCPLSTVNCYTACAPTAVPADSIAEQSS